MAVHVTARLTRQNQITLPRSVRDRLDLDGGDTVIFELEDDGVRIVGRELRLEEVLGSIVLPEPASPDFGVEIEEATAMEMEKYWDDSRLGVPGSADWPAPKASPAAGQRPDVNAIDGSDVE